MDWRDKLFENNHKLWVLISDEANDTSVLSPLHSRIDWYTNNMISKLIRNQKVNFNFDEKTLLGGHFSLPAQKILLVGLGDTKTLTPQVLRKFIQDLGQTIRSLGEESCFVAIDSRLPKEISEIEKSRTLFDALPSATISVG